MRVCIWEDFVQHWVRRDISSKCILGIERVLDTNAYLL